MANSATNGGSRLIRSIERSSAARRRTSCSRCWSASLGRIWISTLYGAVRRVAHFSASVRLAAVVRVDVPGQRRGAALVTATSEQHHRTGDDGNHRQRQRSTWSTPITPESTPRKLPHISPLDRSTVPDVTRSTPRRTSPDAMDPDRGSQCSTGPGRSMTATAEAGPAPVLATRRASHDVDGVSRDEGRFEAKLPAASARHDASRAE